MSKVALTYQLPADVGLTVSATNLLFAKADDVTDDMFRRAEQMARDDSVRTGYPCVITSDHVQDALDWCARKPKNPQMVKTPVSVPAFTIFKLLTVFGLSTVLAITMGLRMLATLPHNLLYDHHAAILHGFILLLFMAIAGFSARSILKTVQGIESTYHTLKDQVDAYVLAPLDYKLPSGIHFSDEATLYLVGSTGHFTAQTLDRAVLKARGNAREQNRNVITARDLQDALHEES